MIFHKRDKELITLWWWQNPFVNKVKGKMKTMSPRYGGEKEADKGLWIDCKDKSGALYYIILKALKTSVRCWQGIIDLRSIHQAG